MIKEQKKIYKAWRERIDRNVITKDGSNTNELYNLEIEMRDAIDNVVKWREKHFKEKYWEEALPQTLLSILDGWDYRASEVASRCFLKIPGTHYRGGIEKEFE